MSVKRPLDLSKENHMDLANQIDNKWERDSVLALVNKKTQVYLSIRFKNIHKTIIRKKYISDATSGESFRQDKKIIALLFAYMIFNLLRSMRDLPEKVLICPDHRPTREVQHFIQKIAARFGLPHLTKEIEILFMDRRAFQIPRRTPAHAYAKKVLRGKFKSSMVVDVQELDRIIRAVR